MKKTRLTAILLALAMVLGILSACGGGSGGEGDSQTGTPNSPNEPDKVYLENVYNESAVNLSENLGSGGSNVSGVIARNGRIYYGVSDRSGSRLMSVNIDGSDTATIVSFETVTEGTVMESTFIQGFDIDDEGNVWVSTYGYSYDSADPYSFGGGGGAAVSKLVKIAPDGTELLSVDPSALAEGNSPYFYIRALLTDKDGNPYIYDGTGVLVLHGGTGEKAFYLREPEQMSALTRANDGSVVYTVSSYDNSGGTFTIKNVAKKIDFAAQSASAGLTLTGGTSVYELYPGSGNYLFYSKASNDLIGFRSDTGVSETVINFMNSDIDSDTISTCLPLDDGAFLATIRADFMSGISGFSILTPDPDAAITGKTVIRIGVTSLSTSIKAEILAFNKASTDARIEVVDYSKNVTSGNFYEADTFMDMDIVAGRAPDILCFMVSSNSDKYISKGVLEDLYPYIDGDQYIERGDLFENVLKAAESDGKLYNIVPSFTVSTYVGKQSVFGDTMSVTLEELIAIADARPESSLLWESTASSWLQQAYQVSYKYFVDWTNGVARFDSPRFIGLLEFSNRLPQTTSGGGFGGGMGMGDFTAYYNDMQTSYQDGRTLLMMNSVYSARIVRDMRNQFGEDVAFVGVPSEDGISGNGISPIINFSINASSKHKDLAWSFISRLLREDYKPQGNASFMFNGIPLNKKAFEKTVAEEQLPLTERDLSAGVSISAGIGSFRFVNSVDDVDMDDPVFSEYPLTDAEVAQLMAVIEGAQVFTGQDTKIQNIITEEISAYYGGIRSAEETAQLIQSRVTLYINESR